MAAKTDKNALKDLKEMIALGMDVNQFNKNGDRPLTYAVKNNWPKCVKYLINHGADINLKDLSVSSEGVFQTSPFWISIYEGHYSCTLVLIAAGVDISELDNYCGVNALSYIFTERGSDKNFDLLVRTLINHKIDVNQAVGLSGVTPLFRAVEYGDISIVMELFKAGAKINPGSCSPLQIAAFEGHSNILKLLISEGSDIKTQGLDAVFYAFKNKCPECVRVLIEAGVDPSLLDQYKVKLHLHDLRITYSGDRPIDILNLAKVEEAYKLLIDAGIKPG